MNDQTPAPQPGARPPAPGDLELVRNFVNTIDVEDGIERLHTRQAVGEWFLERDFIAKGHTVSPADHKRALEFREALRMLLQHNNGEPLEETALETLDRVAGRARLAARFAAHGPPNLEPEASGVDGALGRLAAIVFRAMSEGSWDRLKICRSDTCQWAFYDRSKNHSGAWCTMSICGNRAKARSFRARARGAARSSR